MEIQAPPLIRIQHVDKVYPPRQQAVRDLTLTIFRGEFVVLAGSSGAGKSTLLKLLFAEELPTRGEVIIAENNTRFLSSSQISRLRRRIGVVFQDYKLLSHKTVLENVSFALDIQDIRGKDRDDLAYKMLRVLGLKQRVHAYPRELSGGEQQRVAIARALVNCPDLILADEPTGNLDPGMSESVFDLLVEANRLGATVVVASHNLELIERLNKRTLVFDQGRCISDSSRPGESL